MGLFLTQAELHELTGYKVASRQVHWLKCNGYYVEKNVRGIPRITYFQLEDMRRKNTTTNQIPSFSNHSSNYFQLGNIQHPEMVSEPNFSGLRQKINKENMNG